MNEPMTVEREKRGGSSGAAPCSASVLELGHANSNDAHCLACGFEMVGGRYVGLCPKCGSHRWYRTRLKKESPMNGIGAGGAQLQGRGRDMASHQTLSPNEKLSEPPTK